MDGSGLNSDAIGSITTLVTGFTKIIQAGSGDRIDKPAAMMISLVLSIGGVLMWSVSTGQDWSVTWLFGQATAVSIVCLASIGLFSVMQAVQDRVTAKLQGTGDGTNPPVQPASPDPAYHYVLVPIDAVPVQPEPAMTTPTIAPNPHGPRS